MKNKTQKKNNSEFNKIWLLLFIHSFVLITWKFSRLAAIGIKNRNDPFCWMDGYSLLFILKKSKKKKKKKKFSSLFNHGSQSDWRRT